MLKALFLAIAITLVAGQRPHSTAAAAVCSCLEQTPAEAGGYSSASFAGRVVSFDPPDYSRVREVTVSFAVTQTWKGPAERTLRVTTPSGEPACGYTFEAGGEYLVYARGPADGLTASLCSRTRPIGEAAEDLRFLGDGAIVRPDAAAGPSQDDDDDVMSRLVQVIAAGALAVALIWIGMRIARRHSR